MAMVIEDIEWIIPGEDWPLAGTHRGLPAWPMCLMAPAQIETTYPKPPEFITQGKRVIVVGVATGAIKATSKPFEDEWVFDMPVRDGKVARIQEYIDTQALARASRTDTQS